jgi:phosphoserine phosphatase
VQNQAHLKDNGVASVFLNKVEEHLNSTQTDIRKWTAEEFQRLVLESKPEVAVFDCDGTLWNGDSGDGFMVWSIEQGLVSRSTSDWIDARHRSYLAGNIDEAQICGEVVQIYAGLRDEELRAAAARYVLERHENVFEEMASLVAALRQAGSDIWAVSSTNKWVVVEGCRGFGIPEERILAVELRVANGLITSQIVSLPSGASKATALVSAGVPHPGAVFGNSVHDLEMLEIARHAYPVNPSPALLKAAAARGWGYFQPKGAQGGKVGGE